MNTVSLEVGKELFELGWRKECGFFYFKEEIYTSELWDRRETNGEHIEAPQLHEILEVIKKVKIQNKPLKVRICLTKNKYSIFGHLLKSKEAYMGFDKNPHDAAGKLLIWCVKNNYITL